MTRYVAPASVASGASAERDVRGVIFDLDGTIYRGSVPIPGAASAIAALRTAGVRVVFASNNPTATATDYALKLTALEIAASERDVLTSSGVAGWWLQNRHPAARVFVIGEPSLIGELTLLGVDVVDSEEADIVLAAFDRTFDYVKWNTGFQVLRKNALFVITNPDATCPVVGGMAPTAPASPPRWRRPPGARSTW